MIWEEDNSSNNFRGITMKEIELIQLLTAELPASHRVIAGPGDDCAVIDLGLSDSFLLLKTDAIVEGVHFTADTSGERIGRKAMARCLSDIAAMAGQPQSALITLGLPNDYSPDHIEAIYQGIKERAAQFQTDIVGGETTANQGSLMISVSLLGTVARSKCVYRKGSQSGDALFVSGELGGSIAEHHLDFLPRIEEARWLAEHFDIHAMIDLSDGLASDLKHILDVSGCGATLLKTALPIRQAARLRAKTRTSEKPPVVAALTDGEDYELLFTVASKEAVSVLDGWKRKFPDTQLTCIGKITEEPGLYFQEKEGNQAITLHGYEHFS